MNHTEDILITDGKTADDAAGVEERRADLTLDAIGDAVLSTDVLGKVTYLNPVAERLTGWLRTEAEGRPLTDVLRIIDGTTREPARNPLEQAIAFDTVFGLTPDCVLISRSGFETAIEDSASPIHSREGLVVGAVIVFRDVGEARARTMQALHLAHHDPLTDLPNRTLLDDRLGRAMASARRYRHRLAVMFLDLDRFKQVNDTQGHATGDLVLRSVAQRLLACVRDSDTVSRQGGDEFVVLLPEIAHADDAAASAGKIVAALAAPHAVGTHRLRLTATVGISLYPDDGRIPRRWSGARTRRCTAPRSAAGTPISSSTGSWTCRPPSRGAWLPLGARFAAAVGITAPRSRFRMRSHPRPRGMIGPAR